MKRIIVSALTLIICTIAFFQIASAQEKNQIEKIWYNQEKTSMIQIYLAKDGKYYGKIYKLKEPNDKETGQARTDKENPDEKSRNTPLQGLLILKGYSVNPENKNEYTGGNIYDPKNGKTYCGKITYKGSTLDLRGYICNFSILGRTSEWTEVKDTNTF